MKLRTVPLAICLVLMFAAQTVHAEEPIVRNGAVLRNRAYLRRLARQRQAPTRQELREEREQRRATRLRSYAQRRVSDRYKAYLKRTGSAADTAQEPDDQIEEIRPRVVRRRNSINAQQAAQVLGLTNEIRTAADLPALIRNTFLEEAAIGHAKELERRNYMSHTNSKGESVGDRIKTTGYVFTKAAENIARGQSTARDAVEDWMNSPDHAKNILDPDLEEIGIGVYGLTWVQDFGTPKVEYVIPSDASSQVFTLVNQERLKADLPTLSQNKELTEAAHVLALDMQERSYFSSTTPEEKTLQDRVNDTEYLTAGGHPTVWSYLLAENIARGNVSPETIVEQWMESEGHRSSILHTEFKDTGIAVVGTYWVQTFGVRNTELPNPEIQFGN